MKKQDIGINLYKNNSVSFEQYMAITIEGVFTRENKLFYAYLVILHKTTTTTTSQHLFG
jgi:hypothetical protein